MKKIKHFSMVAGLLPVLSLSVFAGEIHIGGAPPSPPEPPPATAPGDIYIPGDIHIGEASNSSVTDVALNLLQELLLVF